MPNLAIAQGRRLICAVRNPKGPTEKPQERRSALPPGQGKGQVRSGNE